MISTTIKNTDWDNGKHLPNTLSIYLRKEVQRLMAEGKITEGTQTVEIDLIGQVEVSVSNPPAS